MPGSRKRSARQREEEGCQARGGGMPESRRRDARQREEGDASGGEAALPVEKAGALAQRGWEAGLPRAVGAARVRVAHLLPRDPGPERGCPPSAPSSDSTWRLRCCSLERGRRRERLQRARHLVMS